MRSVARDVFSLVFVSAAVACGGDSTVGPDGSLPDGTTPDVSSDCPTADAGTDVVDSSGPPILPTACNGSVASTSTPATGLPNPPSQLTIPTGFKMEVIAQIGSARELAALPNGDLLVGTNGSSVYIIPSAEADAAPGKSQKFADRLRRVRARHRLRPVFVHDLSRYAQGHLQGDAVPRRAPHRKLRQPDREGAPGNGHAEQRRRRSRDDVGCVRQRQGLRGRRLGLQRVHRGRSDARDRSDDGLRRREHDDQSDALPQRDRARDEPGDRNGVGRRRRAGQPPDWDIPYEFFDAVTVHSGVADYGWPDCEENHNAFGSGANCTNAVAPLVELPAYSTIIGAAFYPT